MKRSDMRLTILPKTTLSKSSVIISVVFIILIWTKIQFSIHVPTFAIGALGLIGFIVSIIAIFKNKDRSVLIFLPVLVGLIIILWTAAEFIFPH
jgi:hypothetical protein